MSEPMTSTKPYIVRAFYDWISDNQLTPYIAVDVSVYGVMVPMAFVNDGQIVLNISSAAVGSISMVGSQIEFSARFGGKLEHLVIPYGAISAIYAKENGAGTTLAIEQPEIEEEIHDEPATTLAAVRSEERTSDEQSSHDKPAAKGRATLKVIK